MEVSLCTKHCSDCWYRKKFHGYLPYCDYLLMTGHRRPCPGGDGCTVKIACQRVHRKRGLSEEERRERLKKNKHAYYERHKEEICAREKAKRAEKRRLASGRTD